MQLVMNQQRDYIIMSKAFSQSIWVNSMNDSYFMSRAIRLSHEGVQSGGGPFGAVIVRDGRIIGEGKNQVVPTADPTAHAEIVAIRHACRMLRTHVLEEATIFTSCEPCPMCLGAIWWARIARIVYGNTREDAASIGFDDEEIYREVASRVENRKIPMHRLMAREASESFRLWLQKADRVAY